MIILQINVVVNSGSTGRIAEEIGQTAINAGWESYIAYGREKGRLSQSHKIRIGTDWDIKMHGVQTRVLDNHALGKSSRSATKNLIKQIEQIKPDVIHLHNVHGYYINAEVLFNYLSKLDTPVVWTFHDCWPFTGHCSYFDYAGCDKWKTGCYECPLKKSYPASLVIDRSKKNYEDKKRLFNSAKNMTIVTVSKWLKTKVDDSFLNHYPVKVINNGIDTSIFKVANNIELLKAKHKLQNTFVLLGVATAWGRRKGLHDYYKISDKLNEDYQIILVGLTKEQIKELPKGIIGIERTESVDELVEYYNIADIVMNISYEETFGMTTPEGFACGTPSIVYNATASPELITDDTGIIVEKGDIEGVVDAINEIKQNGKAHYSDACRNRALQLYRKEDRYRDYLELYDKILK